MHRFIAENVKFLIRIFPMAALMTLENGVIENAHLEKGEALQVAILLINLGIVFQRTGILASLPTWYRYIWLLSCLVMMFMAIPDITLILSISIVFYLNYKLIYL